MGYIHRVNLFPNARCVASGAKPDATNANIEAGAVSSGLAWFRFTIKNHEQGGPVYFHRLRTVPGETYVFRAKIHANADTQALIFDAPSQNPLVDIDIKQMESVYKEARFIARSDQTGIRFSVPMIEGGYLMFAEPQLELASTYDAAVSGGGSGSSPGTPCRDRNGIRRAGDAR